MTFVGEERKARFANDVISLLRIYIGHSLLNFPRIFLLQFFARWHEKKIINLSDFMEIILIWLNLFISDFFLNFVSKINAGNGMTKKLKIFQIL